MGDPKLIRPVPRVPPIFHQQDARAIRRNAERPHSLELRNGDWFSAIGTYAEYSEIRIHVARAVVDLLAVHRKGLFRLTVVGKLNHPDSVRNRRRTRQPEQ